MVDLIPLYEKENKYFFITQRRLKILIVNSQEN